MFSLLKVDPQLQVFAGSPRSRSDLAPEDTINVQFPLAPLTIEDHLLQALGGDEEDMNTNLFRGNIITGACQRSSQGHKVRV